MRAELARAIEAIVESLIATKGKLVELRESFGGRPKQPESGRTPDGGDDGDAATTLYPRARAATARWCFPRCVSFGTPTPGGA